MCRISFLLIAALAGGVGLGRAETDAFADPASHQVKIWGTIQNVDPMSSTVWIKTPRQVVSVLVGSGTRIRIGAGEGRLDDLKAGQAVSCVNQWQDGVLLCRELVVIRPGG